MIFIADLRKYLNWKINLHTQNARRARSHKISNNLIENRQQNEIEIAAFY